MKKTRNTYWILVLTALLILLCALLPQFMGLVQDRRALNHVDYSQSAQVQLEIQQDMTSLGKLALLCRMEGVLEVPEAMAEMTVEEAEQAALDALQSYVDAGLIPEFPVWHIEAKPLLILTPEEVDLAGLVWAVTVLSDEEGIMNVSLDIDDATGTLLRLNYAYEYWGETDLDGTLARFAETYFGGLAVENYENFATEDLENRYLGDNVAGMRYRIGDTAYGEVNLDLYVYQYGFYVDTPHGVSAVAPA